MVKISDTRSGLGFSRPRRAQPLPQRDDIDLPSPRTGRGVASAKISTPNIPRMPVPTDRLVPRVAGITERAFDSTAGAIDDVAVAVAKDRERENGLDAIRAKAKFDRDHIELRRNLDENPDYQSYDSVFSEQSTKITEDSLAMIRDPELRERAALDFSVGQERYRDGVLKEARSKKDEADFLTLNEALESQRLVYLDPKATDAERIEARRSMEASIRIAQESGVVTARQAAAMTEQYVKGVAKEDAAVLLEADLNQTKDEIQGVAPARRFLKKSESGGDHTVVNKLGYAGFYQFGAPRLVDLGFYKPGEKEKVRGKWSGQKWSGKLSIPGFPEVKTIQDFLANSEAQESVFDAHVLLMNEEIKKSGLDAYEGEIVGGVKITREGLYAMLHLGGVKSTKAALVSNGEANPSDANGTTVLDYAARAAGYSRVTRLDPVDLSELQVKIEQKELAIKKRIEKQQKEFSDNFSPVNARADRDPAGYVRKYSPEVQEAFDVANHIIADPTADPAEQAETFQKALEVSLDEQRSLGLSDRNAKLLPHDHARAIVNQLLEEKGPDATRAFYEIRDLAGPYFDRVYGELVDQKLPAEFQVLALLDPIGNPAQVNSVSQIIGASTADLKKDLGPDGSTIKADLLDPIEEDLGDFRRAFEFGPIGETAKQQAANMIEAAKKVGLNHFRLTGDLAAAQEQAVSIITDNVVPVTGQNLNALVPREANISEADVEDATRLMQMRHRIDVFDPVPIGVAEAQSAGDLGEAQAKFRRERTRSTATNYGVWTTNAQSDGLVLVVPVGSGTSFVRLFNENGDPYEIKFSDIPKLAAERRATSGPRIRTDPDLALFENDRRVR